MLTSVVITFVVTLVLFAAGASAARATDPLKAQLKAAKHDRDVIRFFKNHPKQARSAEGQRQILLILDRVVTQLNDRTLQSVKAQTWPGAVGVVARYFGADVAAWELSCSQTGSEGGWGRWVWNAGYAIDDDDRAAYIAAGTVPGKPGGSSGAGGWLQFLHGTFDGIIDKAIATARAHGMYVPESARSWLSPLGQALAGMQMVADGRRGEWAGWAC